MQKANQADVCIYVQNLAQCAKKGPCRGRAKKLSPFLRPYTPEQSLLSTLNINLPCVS